MRCIIDPEDLRIDKRRCPAIMFAVSRMVNVRGRMIILIDSMITINGIRIDGVP